MTESTETTEVRKTRVAGTFTAHCPVCGLEETFQMVETPDMSKSEVVREDGVLKTRMTPFVQFETRQHECVITNEPNEPRWSGDRVESIGGS